MSSQETKGCVFDIQRYSLEDGPGIRTTIFTKGCPLRCRWCSNPESQSPLPELQQIASLCCQCGTCVAKCPEEALRDSDGRIVIDRSRCTSCGACAETCPTGSLRMVGRTMDVDEVLTQVEKDEAFYRRSSGGVTVSGGEPSLQPDFVESLLIECQNRGYHTTLDTCGYTSWKVLERLSTHADLIHYDVKHLNSELHRKYTDVPNERILDNLRKLAKSRDNVIVRLPLLKQINDQEAHLTQLAWLIKRLGSSLSVTVLPYHAYGVNKYASLGMSYGLGENVKCTEQDMDRAVSIFRNYGISVTLEAH